jgi:hypothetical protein
VRFNLRGLAALPLLLVLTIIPAAPVTFAADPTAPPTVAGDDAYTSTEDEVLVVGAADGILANDPPGACLIGISTTGSTGTFSVGPDGGFTYTPPANFHGPAGFLYRISNTAPCSELSTVDSEAFVTITVAPVNDAPTAAADSFGVIKDHTLNVNSPGVLLNDHDVDGDPLTAVKVTNPAHGVVTLAADGSFSYTPGSGYVGPDAFSYKASDGTASSPTRVVTLTVTAVPPVPTPTPIPTPAPTAVPTPSPEITAEPADSPESSASEEPNVSVAPAPSPTVSSSAVPSPSASPGDVADGGGVSLPVLLVFVLLVLLVGFGAALYGPGGGGPPPPPGGGPRLACPPARRVGRRRGVSPALGARVT